MIIKMISLSLPMSGTSHSCNAPTSERQLNCFNLHNEMDK